MVSRITIIKIKKPSQKEVNRDLQWFSESFGLFGERDKEKSCFRVFIELLKAARFGRPLTSDQIAFKSHLTRATVIHHLNKLNQSGLVLKQKNLYILRAENLENVTLEIKKDLLGMFQDLEDMARELDEELGLIKRTKSDSRTLSD
ncbi:ArsR family transcriptional regulator [Candidatus Woesearchaeota archaeon]|nr:ArsR family transcriptional regulator [Candidatus Woesearchaeota archaeon]